MAELKDRIRADLTAAMKQRDKQMTTVLRSVLTAIGTEEVSGEAAHELTAEAELAIVNREVRKRKEAAEGFASGGREEQAAAELAEAELLSAYLPAPLTDDELAALVEAEIAAVTEQLGERPTMKQMGQVIKGVNAKAQGRADGSAVAARVRAALSSSS
ncbi:GatB/YqeY domain-containing protein [Naumannella huperziae]